ncbi:decaprenyl-phosphate phosphoribosyltransferase [Actinomadura barringtoniae]|nr:decaprenyl-phosphate phosphoribosyltransferase [Actinomadura barringtoniae]
MSMITLTPTVEETGSGVAAGLIRAVRPRQWVKNVLVLAAPFASGGLTDPVVIARSVVAFVVFAMAASAIYLVNDARDVAEDRVHPTKCRRPIAAGIVPVPLAIGVAVALVLGSLGMALVTDPRLALVIGVYLAVQTGYCLGLKDQPVIDIAIVSSGFLLRAIAGGAAAGIALSQWFLLATAFGSLFMVAGKRYAEVRLFESTGAQIRKALTCYSASYLRFVWTLAATVLVTTYGLWAFEMNARTESIWPLISMVPFAVGVLRYAVDVDGTAAGEPEGVVLGDRMLLALGVSWACALALAVYLP